jgi:hypothetical protein
MPPGHVIEENEATNAVFTAAGNPSGICWIGGTAPIPVSRGTHHSPF